MRVMIDTSARDNAAAFDIGDFAEGARLLGALAVVVFAAGARRDLVDAFFGAFGAGFFFVVRAMIVFVLEVVRG
jgi:hypothetical protein